MVPRAVICSPDLCTCFLLKFSIFRDFLYLLFFDIDDTSTRMPTKAKKSVSFQASTTDELKEETNAESQVEIPFNSSALLVPFHLPVILGFIFNGLLENPRTLLIQGIPTLVAAQFGYGILITKRFKSSNTNSKKKSKSSNNNNKNNNNTPILLVGSILISILLSIPLFIVIILFGAPLYGLLTETFLLSVHLSLILFYPILVSYKLDFAQFLQSFTPGSGDQIYQQLYKNQLIFASIGGVVGAWFGVLPIPLDWDRDWQQWPITILVGGYIGSLLGSILSLPFSE